MTFISFSCFIWTRGNKTPPVPQDRGRSNAVPPLFAISSQIRPQRVFRLKRYTGRTRPTLIGLPFRRLLQGVFTLRFLSPSHRPGALWAGNTQVTCPFQHIGCMLPHQFWIVKSFPRLNYANCFLNSAAARSNSPAPSSIVCVILLPPVSRANSSLRRFSSNSSTAVKVRPSASPFSTEK